MKKCSSCRITQSLTQFQKNRARKDGLSGACKTCEAARRLRTPIPPAKTYADYLKESQERECYNKRNAQEKINQAIKRQTVERM